MKKFTLKKSVFGLCVLVGVSMQSFAGDPVVPSFQKLSNPVPNQEKWEDDGDGNPVGSQQFYHIRDVHAAWGDFNNDGYLDLFYGGRNEHIEYWAPEKNVLYINKGDGVGDGQMLRAGYWNCPVWFDFNNDGYLDLIVSGIQWRGDGGNDKDSYTRIYQNMGPNEDGNYFFEEIPSAEGIKRASGGIRRIVNESDGGKSHQFISVGD